jgi:fucose 4-O-acetylase-like acetyltransferase
MVPTLPNGQAADISGVEALFDSSRSAPAACGRTVTNMPNRSRTSLALVNLRAFVILLVIGFHSSLAYLGSQPPSEAPFDSPPYLWLAFPILDQQRWFGFDLFCAYLYVFLMPFMFFLSGLFVWPSLARKGPGMFLYDRCLRLGLPFVLGVYLLMPLAHYPVYRVTASDPSWSAFWSHWIALPFWPSGPLWFLWELLALNMAATALYRLAPRSGEFLGRISEPAGAFPGRYFALLLIISSVAYIPFASIFKPWDLTQAWGPFAFQPGRLAQYVVYFFAGVGVGVPGIELGLLAADGMLARRSPAWMAGALATFVLWMIATALTMEPPQLTVPGLRSVPGLGIIADFLFALSCASACFAFAAVFLRFAARRWPAWENLSQNAYAIYLIHYVFVVWLQFLLLGVPLPAVAKAVLVFSGTLALSWGVAALLGRVPLGAALIGAPSFRRLG